MAEQGFLKQKPGFATIAIHHAQEPEKWSSAAVVTPIVTSTTFKQPAPGEHTVKNTSSNLKRFCLEKKIKENTTW